MIIYICTADRCRQGGPALCQLSPGKPEAGKRLSVPIHPQRKRDSEDPGSGISGGAGESLFPENAGSGKLLF